MEEKRELHEDRAVNYIRNRFLEAYNFYNLQLDKKDQHHAAAVAMDEVVAEQLGFIYGELTRL